MTNKIQQLLAKQQEEVKSDSFSEILEISEYNESRFTEITEVIKSVINKEVWNEFSFGSVSGKILGILRTLNFEFKHRENLCKELGISALLVDMYYQHAGNAPYYSKMGEVVPARPMNVVVTRELVKRTATELNIIITDSDLVMINEENENVRNVSALQKAEDTKANGGSFTQNVNIQVNGKINKHLEGILDA